MNVYFARHGQTDWNILAKVQGTTDIPLNATGIGQADQLCEYFEKESISLDKIYTSRQIRAVQTAQRLSEHFSLEYETVPGLEEMNMGAFEGHNWDEIQVLFPEELKRWNSNKRYEKTPGGESYQMVMERLFAALDRILGEQEDPSDGNILIISHGGVIMTLLAMQKGIPFEEAHLKIAVPNATPLCFRMDELMQIKRKACMPKRRSVKPIYSMCVQPSFIIGTNNEDGSANFAPITWVSATCEGGDNYLLVISMFGSKQTKTNVLRSGIFSANLVSRDMLPLMDYFGTKHANDGAKKDLPYEVVRGEVLDVPVLDASRWVYECEVARAVETGESTTFFCHIRNIQMDERISPEDVFDVDLTVLDPVIYSRRYYSLGKSLGKIGDISPEK